MVLVNDKYISVRLSKSGLRKKNRNLSVLMEINNFLSTALKLQEVLDGALLKVLKYFGFKTGRVYLLDEAGQSLLLAASTGIDPSGLERITINGGFSGKAVRTRSFIAQYVSDLEDKARSDLLSSHGLKIIVCLPLMVMARVLGVMNLATDKAVRLDHGKIALLVAIGNATAIALDRGRIYEELEKNMREAKERKDAVELFAHTVSHDLKSPAVAIYGLANLLQKLHKGAPDEKSSKYCDQIKRAAEQVVGLVDEIDGYLRARNGAFCFERVRVKEVIDAVMTIFSERLNQRGIRCIEPDVMLEITADRHTLTRIFQNLVENALKYGGECLSEIRIDYRENRKFHVFSVRDDGAGICCDDPQKLFKPFCRHETSAGTDGAGLGLAIVKEIAHRHGGDAWLGNESGRGATFYVSIAKDLKAEDS